MADRTAKQEAKLDYMAFAVAGVAGGHGVMEYMKAGNVLIKICQRSVGFCF